MKNTVIFLCVLFAALVSFTLLADASTAIKAPADASVQRAVDAPEELAPEWRWKREPVRFDHMYMHADQQTRLLGLGR